MVNALQPDILFITGDILENLDELPAAREIIRSFKVKIGIYGVPGNTDYHRFNLDMLASDLAQSGLIMLRNENRRIDVGNGRELWLAGVDDPVNKRDDLATALQG